MQSRSIAAANYAARPLVLHTSSHACNQVPLCGSVALMPDPCATKKDKKSARAWDQSMTGRPPN